MSGVEPNVLTTFGALIVGGIVTYLISRFGKISDARGAAEAALMGIGPQIIQEQNKQIKELNDRVEKLWDRDQECRRELASATDRIVSLERRLRPDAV